MPVGLRSRQRPILPAAGSGFLVWGGSCMLPYPNPLNILYVPGHKSQAFSVSFADPPSHDGRSDLKKDGSEGRFMFLVFLK